MSGRGPHGDEAYKDLIYLNDAYERAIIDSQGQEGFWHVEDSLNALLWNVVSTCAFSGPSDIQPLKMQTRTEWL